MRPLETGLVLTPSLSGHRSVYASTVAEFLLARGLSVVIAASFDTTDHSSALRVFDRLQESGRVSWVDISGEPGHGVGLHLNRLVDLIRTTNAQATVLLDADCHLQLLASQLSPGSQRIPGRRVGILLRNTNFIYQAKRLPWLVSGLESVRNLTRWGIYGRPFMDVLLPRFRLLDAALCPDDLFVESRGAPFVWLPDVYRYFGPASSDADVETSRWKDVVDQFLARNRPRPVLLYYGREQPRRGYDLLLKLAVEEGGCFIHCGLRDPQASYETDTGSLRGILQERGAILETNEYLADHSTAEVFFRATRCLVLPYRSHYGSSGVMLQALSVARPVLVPEVGLMGRWVKSHGLGLTYKADDWTDLRRKFKKLQLTPNAEFEDRIRRFVSCFSLQQVHAALSLALGDSSRGAVLPGVAAGTTKSTEAP